jgi:hypothetical protein
MGDKISRDFEILDQYEPKSGTHSFHRSLFWQFLAARAHKFNNLIISTFLTVFTSHLAAAC